MTYEDILFGGNITELSLSGTKNNKAKLFDNYILRSITLTLEDGKKIKYNVKSKIELSTNDLSVFVNIKEKEAKP